MRQQKKRLIKNFEPLTTSVHFALSGDSTNVSQTYYGDSSTYVPDRTTSPLTIYPYVNAMTRDGSWQNGNANQLISDLQWFVGDQKIQEAAGWAGKYIVITSGDKRGALVVSKNIELSTSCKLSFSCRLNDSRMGRNITIYSEGITLYTTDVADDDWSLSIDQADNILYDPLADKWLLHDYKTANGYESTTPTSNRGTYKCNINVTVNRGTSEANADHYNLYLYDVATSGTWSGKTEITNGVVNLDLRLITRKSYALAVEYNGKEVARRQFSVKRVTPKYSVDYRDIAPIAADDKIVHTELYVTHNKTLLEHAGLYFDITWYTDTAAKQDVVQCYGAKAVIYLSKTGIGDRSTDSYLDVSPDVELSGAYTEVADENGEIYTNENGEIYINN